ncbi:FAD-dependent monooxygenase [Azospirillum sp. SYSU D00513]|uniref:NAD(P)/FAD-dependent oxidoreductase n=1 Tax=Azospirillum sp. SYSU D00513 TaxID=2812561 RepID=UPI001A965EEE|nr:FAD-dependent monooxygenase [Azospirillum sp. SYSU D00513]
MSRLGDTAGLTTDVLVIGGGPAGSAAAAWLAEAGVKVILVERTAGPHHKVCGEFVSVEAGRLLAELGLDPGARQGSGGFGAPPVERVRLVRGADSVESPLPFPASSLSRHELDERLLDAARARGVRLIRGVSAQGMERLPEGVRVPLSDGTVLEAEALFLATGKHDLRGHPRGPGIQEGLIGLKMHLDLAPDAARGLDGVVELLLFDGGYAGLQPVGTKRANLCLLVSRDRYRDLGADWTALLAHMAGASPPWQGRLAEARPLWRRPLAIYKVPYGHVAGPEDGPVFRLGDQMAVIPSFAGDGIAMALRSARLAADAYLADGPQAGRYHRRAARQFGPGVRTAAWASRALERPSLQALAMAAAARAPGLLSWAASRTRLGE